MTALFVYSLKSALVLILLYLPYTLMLRQESFFRMNRLTLLAILALALVLPLCDFPSLAINDQPVVYEVHQQVMQMMQPEESAPMLSVSSSQFSWVSLVTYLYLIGVVIIFCIRFFQLVRIGRIVRKGSLWSEEQGIATVYCHIGNVVPFSWMRNIVISESDYQTEGSREILLHEKAHILCRHSLDILLLTLAELIQWWTPVVYMLGNSLRDVHEYEADDHVLRQGVSLHHYQTLLVKKAMANNSYAFANNFNQSFIKKRLYMMNHPKSNPWLRSKVLYILPLSLFVLMAFATPKLSETIETVVDKMEKDGGKREMKFDLAGTWLDPGTEEDLKILMDNGTFYAVGYYFGADGWLRIAEYEGALLEITKRERRYQYEFSDKCLTLTANGKTEKIIYELKYDSQAGTFLVLHWNGKKITLIKPDDASLQMLRDFEETSTRRDSSQ